MSLFVSAKEFLRSWRSPSFCFPLSVALLTSFSDRYSIFLSLISASSALICLSSYVAKKFDIISSQKVKLLNKTFLLLKKVLFLICFIFIFYKLYCKQWRFVFIFVPMLFDFFITRDCFNKKREDGKIGIRKESLYNRSISCIAACFLLRILCSIKSGN